MMPDREKVIKDNAIRGLQSAIEISGALVHLRKEHAEALLALLKEQEEIIHCKDCYYYHKPEYGFTFGDCTRRSAWYSVKENEFCSLAKRKEGR